MNKARPVKSVRLATHEEIGAAKVNSNINKEAAPTPALVHAINELSGMIYAAENNHSALHSRLRRILTEPVTDGFGIGEEAQDSQIEPPLVDVIYNLTARVRWLINCQLDTIDRLQV